MRARTSAAMITACRQFLEVWTAGGDLADVAELHAIAMNLHCDDVAHREGRGFAGPEYDPARDDDRLTQQMGRVFAVLSDGAWRPVERIAELTGDPICSVSAQIRHLRKRRFGSWIIDCGSPGPAHFYRMRNPDGTLLPPVVPVPARREPTRGRRRPRRSGSD